MHDERIQKKQTLWKVALLALLGYAFIFVLLIVLVFAIAFCTKLALTAHGWITPAWYGLLAIVFFFTLVRILRALLHLGQYKPEGVEIGADTPLAQKMRDMCAQIGCPEPSHFYIIDECNAYAGIRRGFTPGKDKPYIGVGLPLAAALTEDELCAILAHELGHHSRRHARTSSWIYRVHHSWEAMEWEAGDVFGDVLERFYDWYVPLFQKHSFAISRANEYEADAIAAETVNADAVISGLVKTIAVAHWQSQYYWPKLFSLTAKTPTPPKTLFQNMLGNISKIGGKHYQNSFQHIDLDKTHPHDTHPSVNDRAKALGIKPVAPAPSAENALALLGDELPRVVQQLSHTWFEDIKESWQIRHEEETATQQQTDQLLKSQTGDRLPLHEHAALAETLECEGNLKAAYDAYTRLYKRRGLNYDKARAALCLAKLGDHDQRVLRLVDQVKKQNPLTDLVVYETMAALADTQGEYEDYLCLHEELDDECEDMLEPYLFELGPLLGWPRKTIPLTLTDSELERARLWFSTLQDVGKVAIAQLPFHPEYPQAPIVLLVVQPRRGATPEPGYTEDLLDGFYLDNGLFRVLDGRFYPLLFARYAKSSRGLLIHSDAKKRIAPSVHEQD